MSSIYGKMCEYPANMEDMLQNIRIVLVETSHTGNIGSTARAMKTMGLTKLWLANPLVKPDMQALALAAGASDVIGNAQIVNTLDEALVGCSLIIGTSARFPRTLPWPMLNPRECGLKSVLNACHAPVALVFGCERVGLTNNQLQKCNYHVTIATNPECNSLNLAMAVQVIAYEVHMAWLAVQKTGQKKTAEHEEEALYPFADDLERFYAHLEQTLLMTGFIRTNHPSNQITNKLRCLFTRARLERKELNILRGVLASIEKSIKNKESKKHQISE